MPVSSLTTRRSNMAEKESNEDIIDQVNATMEWAFQLGYSDNKSVRICRDALTKKGLIEKPEARYAANMFLDLRGLHELGDKYIPLEDVEKAAAE